jgi:hypothetical protein
MTYITVKEMPEEERPRERMARVGPQSLSTAELLALVLRSGAAGRMSQPGDAHSIENAAGRLRAPIHAARSTAIRCRQERRAEGVLRTGRRLMPRPPKSATNRARRCGAHPESMIGQGTEHFVVSTWTHATASTTRRTCTREASTRRCARCGVFRGPSAATVRINVAHTIPPAIRPPPRGHRAARRQSNRASGWRTSADHLSSAEPLHQFEREGLRFEAA